MSRLELLEKLRKLADDWGYGPIEREMFDKSADAIESLQAELIAATSDDLKLDAQRYRHLRNMDVKVPPKSVECTIWDGEGSGDECRGEELDAAVDAAMGATKS